MNYYLKILIFSLFSSVIVLILIHSIGIGRTTINGICPSTPISEYEKLQRYRCVTFGFPMRDFEQNVLGHMTSYPYYYTSKLLLNLFIWSSLIFILFSLARNYVESLFKMLSLVNKITRLAIFLELCSVALITLAMIQNLPVVRGFFETYFYHIPHSWWPSFLPRIILSVWLIFLSFYSLLIPIFIILGFFLGLGGLFHERKRPLNIALAAAESRRERILKRLVLDFPILFSVVLAIAIVIFVSAAGVY